MQKQLTLQEWIDMGNLMKKFHKTYFEAVEILNKVPKTFLRNEFYKIDNEIIKILDKLDCECYKQKSIKKLPFEDFTNIFYGGQKK